MNRNVLTALLAVAFVFSVIVVLTMDHGAHLLWNRQGYAPTQPIAYSHRLHAGEMDIDCQYCHFGADKSRHAGIPPASVCMNCHSFVQATLSAVRAEDELAETEGRSPEPVMSSEIARIYAALAIGQDGKPDESLTPEPIAWTKIHRVPDYVYFDHRPHVGAGVACQTCHGAVETMERVRQVEDLSMGWCVNCHRDASDNGIAGKAVHASTDCVACHY